MGFTLLNVSYDVFALAAQSSQVYYYQKSWPGMLDGYILACGIEDIIYRAEITAYPELTYFTANIYPVAESVQNEDDAVALVALNSSFSQILFDIQDTVIYIGKATRGTLTSEAKWTIKKTTLVNGSPTTNQITKINSAIWDNRATEDYQ